jgi:hypothetical protein
MRFRKLRIAFSATCLIACVLLIVLWVRSYSYYDCMDSHLASSRVLAIASDVGGVGVFWNFVDFDLENGNGDFELAVRDFAPSLSALGFSLNWEGGLYGARVPYWFLIVAIAVAPVVINRRWRFTLRILLIATTLVALVLGLIVWASRQKPALVADFFIASWFS